MSGIFNQRNVIGCSSEDEDAEGALVLSVMYLVAVDALLCSSCDSRDRPWSPSVRVAGSGSPAWNFKKPEVTPSSLLLHLLMQPASASSDNMPIRAFKSGTVLQVVLNV